MFSFLGGLHMCNYKTKIIKKKNQYDSTVFVYSTKLHNSILLYMTNWHYHIKFKHPEMSLEIIEAVLTSPDYIYKPSKSSKEFSYQKEIDNMDYRVIIGHEGKNKKSIITAYAISNENYFDWHENYCVYSFEDELEDKSLWQIDFTKEYEEILLKNCSVV